MHFGRLRRCKTLAKRERKQKMAGETEKKHTRGKPMNSNRNHIKERKRRAKRQRKTHQGETLLTEVLRTDFWLKGLDPKSQMHPEDKTSQWVVSVDIYPLGARKCCFNDF